MSEALCARQESDATASTLASALAGFSLASDADDGVLAQGLSLAALRAFCAEHAAAEFSVRNETGDQTVATTLPFEALSTEQVVAAVIKPATAHAGQDGAGASYAQLLAAQVRVHSAPRGGSLLQPLRLGCAVHARTRAPQDARDARGRPLVARATRFVSHAWRYPFADILAALDALAAADAGAEDAYFWLGAARHAHASRPHATCS